MCKNKLNKEINNAKDQGTQYIIIKRPTRFLLIKYKEYKGVLQSAPLITPPKLKKASHYGKAFSNYKMIM